MSAFLTENFDFYKHFNTIFILLVSTKQLQQGQR